MSEIQFRTLVLCGVGLAVVTSIAGFFRSPSPPEAQDFVTTHGVRIVDNAGNVRAVLGFDELDGCGLVAYDSAGVKRLLLSVDLDNRSRLEMVTDNPEEMSQLMQDHIGSRLIVDRVIAREGITDQGE